MNTWRTEFNEKIAAQGTHLPSMYGHLNPSNTPERFAPQRGDQTELDREFLDQREELLAKQEQVERVRAYTMIGDPVADAYAAMIRVAVSQRWSACWNKPAITGWRASLRPRRSWFDSSRTWSGSRIGWTRN